MNTCINCGKGKAWYIYCGDPHCPECFDKAVNASVERRKKREKDQCVKKQYKVERH